MVNDTQKRTTKTGILQLLRSNPSGLTGEKIAQELSVSRVAIWKAIQGLRTNGYTILSDSRGYILSTDKHDTILPFELNTSGYTFHYHKELDSTMTTALHRAIGGAHHGEVVISEIQHNGRGTNKKNWISTDNSLHFTLITRPHILPMFLQRYTLISQIAMVRSLSAVSKKNIFPVWPNDIFAQDTKTKTIGKCGGILIEALSSGTTVSFANIGIGINTQTKPTIEGTETTDTGRKEVLIRFLKEFTRLSASDSNLAEQWQSLSPLNSSVLDFTHQGENKSGIFEKIDHLGNILIGGELYSPGQIQLHTKGF